MMRVDRAGTLARWGFGLVWAVIEIGRWLQRGQGPVVRRRELSVQLVHLELVHRNGCGHPDERADNGEQPDERGDQPGPQGQPRQRPLSSPA
jgi:hypothetical protein